ncbi:sulfite exporter TauE/SafE family protein [Thalassotalea sp. PLHSN55]|uniref:sulfite exporter TauE/SafE family protein n=1 Tax=Thalassotalea sp. PLHSN55 TaxID=3435888 RepID=UPI003F856CC9
MLVLSPINASEILDYAPFSFLGVLGAIFANSTGAGGGVIFIPMFNQLNFTEAQAIATSFGIQCFGMTAGAITWYRHYHAEKRELKLWQGFKRIIAITSITSVIGIAATYWLEVKSPASLHNSFSWFSLLIGVFIVASVLWLKPHRERSQIYWYDWLILSAIGLFGGAVTAWLSVGVGELLAIYLIIRRFDISMAVAAAVVISAISVWAAIWQHTLVNFQVFWQVVIFAGPGAVLGGIFAKTLVTHLSATRLKLFFASWLLVIGIVGI